MSPYGCLASSAACYQPTWLCGGARFPLLAEIPAALDPPGSANQSRVFWLSPDPRQTVRKKPGIAPPNGGRPLCLGGRDGALAQERRVFPGLSLLGLFGGHTCQ